MKTLKTLLLATTVLGAATATEADNLSLHAANAQVRHYLTESGLLNVPFTGDRVVLTEREHDLSEMTRYLSVAGLIETPIVRERFVWPWPDLAETYTGGKRVKHVLTGWGYLDEPVGGSNRTEVVVEVSSGDHRTKGLR